MDSGLVIVEGHLSRRHIRAVRDFRPCWIYSCMVAVKLPTAVLMTTFEKRLKSKLASSSTIEVHLYDIIQIYQPKTIRVFVKSPVKLMNTRF